MQKRNKQLRLTAKDETREIDEIEKRLKEHMPGASWAPALWALVLAVISNIATESVCSSLYPLVVFGKCLSLHLDGSF